MSKPVIEGSLGSQVHHAALNHCLNLLICRSPYPGFPQSEQRFAGLRSKGTLSATVYQLSIC